MREALLAAGWSAGASVESRLHRLQRGLRSDTSGRRIYKCRDRGDVRGGRSISARRRWENEDETSGTFDLKWTCKPSQATRHGGKLPLTQLVNHFAHAGELDMKSSALACRRSFWQQSKCSWIQ